MCVYFWHVCYTTIYYLCGVVTPLALKLIWLTTGCLHSSYVYVCVCVPFAFLGSFVSFGSPVWCTPMPRTHTDTHTKTEESILRFYFARYFQLCLGYF